MLSDPLKWNLLWLLGSKGMGGLKLAEGLVIDICSVIEKELFNIGRGYLTSTLLDQVENLGDFCNTA